MYKFAENRIVYTIVVLVFFLLCVRPVHALTPGGLSRCTASGQITPYSAYGSATACAQVVWGQIGWSSFRTFSGVSITGVFDGGAYQEGMLQYTNNSDGSLGQIGFTFSFQAGGGTCPTGSSWQNGSCVCTAPLVEQNGACVDATPPPSPSEAAAQAAKDAALAAGYSAAAAQSAYDAVMVHAANTPEVDWPHIGSAAARNYEYAVGMGLSAQNAASVASSAANLYVASQPNGFDAATRAQLADTIASGTVDRVVFQSGSPSSVSNGQLFASLAAGALTVGAVGLAVAGAAPIAVALAASAALHAGILAVVDSGASPVQQQAAQSAGARAIMSGATPLQVTLAPQVVAQAVPAAATEPQITAASLAAVSAFQTAPESSWTVPVGMPNNTASVAASVASTAIASGASPDAAAAAAAAAVNTIVSGGSYSAAQTAAQSAGSYVTGGGTTAGAAVIGAQVGQSADHATEGTLKSVLGKLNDFLTFGQGLTVNDTPALNQRATDTQSSFTTSLNQLHSSAIAANETDEASLLGTFVFDPPYATCQPITGVVHGHSVSIDLCPWVDKLRDLIGWLFALFGAYSIYQTIFRPRT